MTGAPIGLRVLDQVISVSTPDPAAHDAIASLLQAFPPADASRALRTFTLQNERGVGWTLTASGPPLPCGSDLGAAVAVLEWAVINAALEARPDFFHLHGAALRLPSRAASVLVIGASGSGKTTLALALMERGYLPYADDVTLLDPDSLTPIPFPRAFHVDGSVGEMVARLRFAPRSGSDGMPRDYWRPAQWAEGAAPVIAAFFPVLNLAGCPTLRRLSAAEGAAALLSHSTTLARDPRFALRTTARLSALVACYAVECGSVDDTAGLVHETAASVTTPPADTRGLSHLTPGID